MKHILGLAALLLLAGLTPAFGSCNNLMPTGGMPFGNYIGGLLTSAGNGQVRCNNGQHYNITANAGTSIGATVTTRKMRGPGGATLAYTLSRDAAHALNWGATLNIDAIQGNGNSGTQSFLYFGTVPAGQTPTPGSYLDTVTMQAIAERGTSDTNSFLVTATVSAACTVAATNLNFGIYTGALTNATSTVTANCTSTTSYNIGFNAGTASGASVGTRKMTGPASATLPYALFRDAAHTLNWGNTIGTDTLAQTGTGGVQVLQVYGQMSVGPLVNPGSYSDTIIVTLTY